MSRIIGRVLDGDNTWRDIFYKKESDENSKEEKSKEEQDNANINNNQNEF